MRRTIILITLLLLVSAGLPLIGQDVLLKGVVTDAKYHTPVPYVAIFVQGAPVGTVANNIGEFTLVIPDSLADRQLVVVRERYKLMYFSLDNLHQSPSISPNLHQSQSHSTQSQSDSISINLHQSPSISPNLNQSQTQSVEIALQPDYTLERIQALQDSITESSGGFAAFLSKAVKFVKNDWIPLGNPETNRFDFGRIQTFPTYNPIEGVRLRGGIASNSRLNPHFFMKGYVAYGFKDQRFKYRGEAIYSFTPKAYHEEEFPKNNLRVVYENDLYSPGEMHPYAPNELLLITYRRSLNEATYRNFTEINYEKESKNGLAYTIRMRKSRFEPQGTLRFEKLHDNAVIEEDALETTEAGVLLRYSVSEAYDQQKRKRIPLETTSPVFFLSHTIGMKDFLGGEVPYHRTELSVQKRFLLGNTGRLDVVGDVMKVWDKVPFPLLVYPNQRYRHLIENNAFFLNRALEFMADEQYTLRMTFVGDDFLLAKIPFTNLLQLRELVSLRVAQGRLSDKNNPAISSDGLFSFPSVSHTYGNSPYVEGTIGITNILGLIRVEYVHRFTYRNHPDALLGAVRVDVTL